MLLRPAKWCCVLVALLLTLDAFALGKYDDFLVRKKAGSTAIEALTSATVRVTKPGATVSTSTGSPSTVIPVYSSANLSGSDPIEINGQAATIVTVDSATQITLNTSVTFTKGSRVLRTAQVVTIYEDSGGTVSITQPASADSNGRLIFFWDVTSSASVDVKAVAGTGANLVIADYPSVQSTAVIGAGSSVDNELVRFNGTTGTSIQGSTSNNPTCTDAGVCTFPGGTTVTGTSRLSGTRIVGSGANADIMTTYDRSSTDYTFGWLEAESRFDASQPLGATSFVIEGTADAFETVITAVDPTADRTFTLPNSDGSMVIMKEPNTPGSTIVFEGLVDDAIETVLFVAEPTSIDKSITFPDATGIIPLMLDQNSPGVTLVWEGAVVDAFETTMVMTNPTADRNITFPDASGTVALGSSNACGTVTYDAVNLPGDSSTSDSVGVTGLVNGQVCICLFVTAPTLYDDVEIKDCWGTTNVLNIRWYNNSGGGNNPGSGTLSYCCMGP